MLPNGGGSGAYTGYGSSGAGAPSSYRPHQHQQHGGCSPPPTNGHFFPMHSSSSSYVAAPTYLPSFDFSDPHSHPHSSMRAGLGGRYGPSGRAYNTSYGAGEYSRTWGGNQELLALFLGSTGDVSRPPSTYSAGGAHSGDGGLSWPMHADLDTHRHPLA
jgi:hypothetical protein